MSNFNPVNGLMALQLWSGAIATCNSKQIAGYDLLTGHLAGLLAQAGGDGDLVDVLRSGAPVEVAAVLRGLVDTPMGETMGGLVHDRFIRRLVSQSYSLQNVVQGETRAPSSSIAGFYRLQVIDQLIPIFQNLVPGRWDWEKKDNASIRASLAANETLAYADRYLAARAMDPESPRLPTLMESICLEIQNRARPEMVDDMLQALNAYLRISNEISRKT